MLLNNGRFIRTVFCAETAERTAAAIGCQEDVLCPVALLVQTVHHQVSEKRETLPFKTLSSTHPVSLYIVHKDARSG